MDADEYYNWMAFDMLKDEKFNTKIKRQITAEFTAEQEAAAIKSMFESIRGS